MEKASWQFLPLFERPAIRRCQPRLQFEPFYPMGSMCYLVILRAVPGGQPPCRTLADVLRMPGKKRAGTLEQIEPRLHSLCMFLRHGDMRSLGCDSGYVQNLGSIRKRKKGLNWHNLLEQQFKQLRSNQAETQKRQSRMSAWIQLTKQVRESLEIEAWPPERSRRRRRWALGMWCCSRRHPTSAPHCGSAWFSPSGGQARRDTFR